MLRCVIRSAAETLVGSLVLQEQDKLDLGAGHIGLILAGCGETKAHAHVGF